jgi:hypothetical protein
MLVLPGLFRRRRDKSVPEWLEVVNDEEWEQLFADEEEPDAVSALSERGEEIIGGD